MTSGTQDNDWQYIDTAPKDRDIELRGWYEPSAEAFWNGSRPGYTYGTGRWLWRSFWSGIIGGNPTHWREVP
jgi:hypothetical protein